MSWAELTDDALRHIADTLHGRVDRDELTYPTQGDFLHQIADEANTELARRAIARMATEG